MNETENDSRKTGRKGTLHRKNENSESYLFFVKILPLCKDHLNHLQSSKLSRFFFEGLQRFPENSGYVNP